MSVTSIKEVGDGRQGGVSQAVGLDRRSWVVQTSDPADTSQIVKDALAAQIGLRYGSAYDTGAAIGTPGNRSRCQNIRALQDRDHRMVWNVDAEYETPAPRAQAGQDDPDPTHRTPLYRFGFSSSVRAFEFAPRIGTRTYYLDGTYSDFAYPVSQQRITPVVTSAFQAFDPKPEKIHSTLVMQVLKNLPVPLNVDTMVNYINTVNSDTFMNSAPYTWWIANISSEDRTENGYYYWETTYELHFSIEGWQQPLMDQGTQKVTFWDTSTNPASWHTEKIQDDSGDVRRDVLLDGKGGVLPKVDTQHSLPGNTVSGVALIYRRYNPMPFAALGLT